jgi:hypothetical protein
MRHRGVAHATILISIPATQNQSNGREQSYVDGLAGVLWCPRKDESLWPTECGRESHFPHFVRVDLE